LWARGNQLPPNGAWRTWLLMAGRGFGKTRTGAETVRNYVESGKYSRVALVGRTAADVRDVMIEGESGILSCCPNWNRPRYDKSLRRITWQNGAIATAYSAEEPSVLRGPQHDLAWCDEFAAWRYMETYDMLQMGLRLGKQPRQILTSTPRPLPMFRKLLSDPRTVVTKGSTFDNKANLAADFIAEVMDKYSGTRLGRQELYAEILDDNPNALWKMADIEAMRINLVAENFKRVVIGLDPAVTSHEKSDEVGIIVAAIGDSGRGYVLEDATMKGTPAEWAKKVVELYHKHDVDRIIGEANNGGDLIEHTLRTEDAYIAYEKIHASRGKAIRAEPISALYEQRRISHVGQLAKLEDEMITFDPLGIVNQKSPNRMDALVIALSALFGRRNSLSDILQVYELMDKQEKNGN
jgi:phage terminase large subunit-like protein